MAWTIGLIICIVLFSVGITILCLPMRISRQTQREGDQEGEAVVVYNNVSRGPLFKLGRLLVLRALTKIGPKGVGLDIGCGPGYLEIDLHAQYPAVVLIGMDINPEMLDLAKHYTTVLGGGVNLVMSDASILPFATDSLEFVVSSISLHHWKNPLCAFAEIKRVLKPGGSFLIVDLRRNSPRIVYWIMVIVQLLSPAAIRQTNGSVGSFWSSYTPIELKQMLTEIRFEELNIDSQIGWMVVRGNKQKI